MRCPTLKELTQPPHGKIGWPWTEESSQLPDKMADGSSWPNISIITPSLNQGRFLEETIRSVLLQGYPNLEYIIIDGGSTDESVAIIKKYAPWLAYWVSESDNGQTQAINKGFKKATGEIVAWLNSDDSYMTDALKVAADNLSINPNDFIFYGDVDFIDENSKFLRKLITKEFDLLNQLYTNMVPQQATFWKRSVFEHIGFLDEIYQHPFDNDFFIRAGMKYMIKYVPIPLANYRLHPSSKTEIASVNFFLEYLAILNKFFKGTNVPEIIYKHRRNILSYWHERTAHKYSELASKKEARIHFWKAISLTPTRIQNITLFAYIIDTYIGSNFGKTIQLMSKNLRR